MRGLRVERDLENRESRSVHKIEKSSQKKETRSERIRIRLKNLITGAHWVPSSNQKLQTFSLYRGYE